jgi:hypothetical protein
MNYPLIVFDVICLPIIIVRLILIYFFGSKYSIGGMEFLDVMFHATNPYFNQECSTTIDVLNEDVRATIKRETKIYIENPHLNSIIDVKNNPNLNSIIDVKNTSNIIIERPKDKLKSMVIEDMDDLNEKDDNGSESGSEKESHSYDSQLDDDVEIIDSESRSDSDSESEHGTIGTEMSESETISETVLDINTDESHVTTETEMILRNVMNKNIKFDLDEHIDQLFDDLENSVTTMTQSSHMV